MTWWVKLDSWACHYCSEFGIGFPPAKCPGCGGAS